MWAMLGLLLPGACALAMVHGNGELPACDAPWQWLTGQLLDAPEGDRSSWLSALRSHRVRCRQEGGLAPDGNDPIFSVAELRWTRSAYIQVQSHPYDLFFYDPRTRLYTVQRWLDDLTTRYGGIDAVLLWPTYTNLGVDDRNNFDLSRLLPTGAQALGPGGGWEAVRTGIVSELRARGVRTLWPFMAWDHGTKDEGLGEAEAMARLQRLTGAVGLNGDTLTHIDESFYTVAARQGTPPALQPELGASFRSLNYTTMEWAEAGGWSGDLSAPAPRVALTKWLQPKRLPQVCRRWDMHRRDAIQHSWFNGIGYETWENVWGIWNGITPRDGAMLTRLRPLYDFLGDHGLGVLTSEEWEPHAITLQPTSVFASYFPREGAPSGASSGSGACRTAAWTLVERTGTSWPAATPMLALDAATFGGCTFHDLAAGTTLTTTVDGSGSVVVSLPMEAHGIGCVLAAGADVTSSTDLSVRLQQLTARQAAESATPLASYSATWRRPPQRKVCTHTSDALPSADTASFATMMARDVLHGQCVPLRPLPLLPPPPTHTQLPPTAVLIPPTGPSGFAFRAHGTEIEPFDDHDSDGFGLDMQFDWETDEAWEGGRSHAHTVHLPSFYLDVTPVSCGRYAEFITATGYAPADLRGWLPTWPSPQHGTPPPNSTDVPVTSISIDEARRFCSWAGGRLPTAVEWQYAAQAGNPSRQYPWGESDEPANRPPPTTGRMAGAPYSSDAAHARRGANPWGLLDLVGNVWQWTADERADDHTRFALLKGGSHYQIDHVSRWYFPTRVALRLDAHSKYMLMDDAYERASTIGMRCAYDAAPGASSGAGGQAGSGGAPTAVMGDNVTAGRGIKAGLLVILILSGMGFSAAVGYVLRRRWLHVTRTAAAHLDSAFDGRITPEQLSPRERDHEPSPWALNDAATEAAQRMKAAIEMG